MQSRRGAAGPFPYPNSQKSRFTAPPGSRQKGHRRSYRELFYAFPLGRGYIHHMGLQTTPHFDASIHRTATEAPACMVVLYGGELARRTELPQHGITIGRDDDNAIHVALHTMSRRHARLFVTDGRHHIEDLGSTNGTFVNEQALTPQPNPQQELPFSTSR